MCVGTAHVKRESDRGKDAVNGHGCGAEGRQGALSSAVHGLNLGIECCGWESGGGGAPATQKTRLGGRVNGEGREA
jgi:hypothetical protein